MITLKDVKQNLQKTLTEIQTMSGRGMRPMSGRLCPIGDLEGFDSINAVECASILSARLGCKPSATLVSYSEHGQPLAVDQIADRIYQKINP